MKKFLTVLLAAFLLLCVCSPALAAEAEGYVFDVDGYLDAETVEQLNVEAAGVSARYGCGVYAAIFRSMAEYGYYDIEDFGEAVYRESGLGDPESGAVILLVMSMEERDYDLTAYGDHAHTAFTDYGKGVLADYFLDDFRRDDWAAGFADYITGCEELLSSAEAGEPVDVAYYDGGYDYYSPVRESLVSRVKSNLPAGVIVGLIAALIYCCILKSKMKSARAATEADSYVERNGVQMYSQMDRFSHTTVVRHHIDRSSGSRSGGGGGTHVNSGGFSHHSGKF